MPSDPATPRWREAVARLTEVTPQSATTPTAVRAGLSIAVPLLLLWGMGRPEWSLYATFGAFAAVYARGATRASRVRTQAAVGLVLTAAVASGAAVALSADRAWLAVPATALWASAAARASDWFRWRPPGPTFVVFAVAACAAVPLGAPSAVVAAATVAAGTAAFAVLLAALEPARLGGPASGPGPADPPLHRQRIHAARCAVAVLLAGGLATATGIGHPYWAMVTAVVPLVTVTLRRQVVRGVHRVLGTVVGLGVAAPLLALRLTPIVTILVAAGLQLTTEVLVGRHYGAALVTITPLALLLVDLARPEPIGQLLADRALETLLGVAVGVLVALATHDRRAGRHMTSVGDPRPNTDPVAPTDVRNESS
ncbi:FUSC family protein [Geodermatophilus sp. SYSU D00697]